MGVLKLEAGKFYRMRNGEKAYVCGANPFEGHAPDYGFIGLIEGEKGVASWGATGFYRSPDVSREYDIVAEWVEPKRIKGWMNVYPASEKTRGSVTDLYGLYVSREQADKFGTDDRIACIEIDVREGEGLEVQS